MSARTFQYLDAAVIHEDDPRAHKVARVVPRDAQHLTVGNTKLGYHKPRKRRPAGTPPVAFVRAREVEGIVAARYNGPCDTDDGEAYAILAASVLVPRFIQSCAKIAAANEIGLHDLVVQRFAAWCSRYLPGLPVSDVQRIALRAIMTPVRFSADAAARLIRLTRAERDALGVTTIGAVDFLAPARKAERKRKDREAKRAKREASPKRPSLTKLEPWKAFGWSRRTWERHGKPHPDDAIPVGSNMKRNTAADGNCVTPPKPRHSVRTRIYPAPTIRLPVLPAAALIGDGVRALGARLARITTPLLNIAPDLRRLGEAATIIHLGGINREHHP